LRWLVAGMGPVSNLEGKHMSVSNKAKNAADHAKGTAKDVVGRVKDDKDLEAEGKVDKTVADLKQAGEKVKDAFRK
jgi:uncharacterized protein YjbJ (UPF0337 family)